MKESIYKTYDDLPLFLNAGTIAKVLGISVAGSYELMHGSDFPVLKIGNRMVVPKEKFISWSNSIPHNPPVQPCKALRADLWPTYHAGRLNPTPQVKGPL